MSARETILETIKRNKPAASPLPDISLLQVTVYDDVTVKFIETLRGIGGMLHENVSVEQLRLEIAPEKENDRFVIDMTDTATAEDRRLQAANAADLEKVYCAIIKGTLGVAENGAVWIPESAMGNRLLPFICEHLVIILERNAIVSTMNHAYDRINSFPEGFGVFIAGPSKTADIEQSLVIGAHGARSLTVYLV